MSKLKNLTSEDISSISEFFGDTLEKEISKKISFKEIDDITIDFSINYDDNQLDVDVDLDLSFDELSNIDQELLDAAIDNAYSKLDSFIDNNYRI